MDGTLIEAWATVKSMRRRDGGDEPPWPRRNPAVDLHGEQRTKETHVAPHDPEAKLCRKAQSAPAKLHYLGHVLMEHPTGLPVDVAVTEANGFAEREAALTMLDRLPTRVRRTLAADKSYDTIDFVAALRERFLGSARNGLAEAPVAAETFVMSVVPVISTGFSKASRSA